MWHGKDRPLGPVGERRTQGLGGKGVRFLWAMALVDMVWLLLFVGLLESVGE